MLNRRDLFKVAGAATVAAAVPAPGAAPPSFLPQALRLQPKKQPRLPSKNTRAA